MTSEPFEGWEPADDVLTFAAGAGQKVTRSQLVRWHKRGVIGRPRVRYQLGRRGGETLYPPGTSTLVVDVSELQVRRRGLEGVVWGLWWSGHDRDLTEIREYISSVCREYDQTIVKLRRLVQTGHKAPGSNWTVRSYLTQSTDVPPPLGTIRRYLNWGGGNSFARFVELLLRTMVGDASQPTAEDAELLERAFHFDAARRTPLGGSPDWWEPDDGSALVWVAHFFSRPLEERVSEISDSDLVAARDEARSFFAFIVTFGVAMRWLFPRQWGLGFGFIGSAVERFLEDPKRQAVLVLIFNALRHDEQLAAGFPSLRDAISDWNSSGFLAWRGRQVLSDEVPGLTELLSPRRLREAFKSPAAQQRLQDDIVAFRAQHAGEIDATVAKHPDVFATRANQETP